MIAAGVNARALASYMGHASVTITYDRYGHLMPGNEDEAAALLDAYLERANWRARMASIGGDWKLVSRDFRRKRSRRPFATRSPVRTQFCGLSGTSMDWE